MWRVDSILVPGSNRHSGWDLRVLLQRPNSCIVLVDANGESVSIVVDPDTVYSALCSYKPYGFVDKGSKSCVIPVDKTAFDFLALVDSVERVGTNYPKSYIEPYDSERSLWLRHGNPMGRYNLLDLLAISHLDKPDVWTSESYTIWDKGVAIWRVQFKDAVRARRIIDKRILRFKLIK